MGKTTNLNWWVYRISSTINNQQYHLFQNPIHIIQVSPEAKVSVKLVANAGIGTIAAGVAKVGGGFGGGLAVLGICFLRYVCVIMCMWYIDTWMNEAKQAFYINDYVDIGRNPHKDIMQYTDVIIIGFW